MFFCLDLVVDVPGVLADDQGLAHDAVVGVENAMRDEVNLGTQAAASSTLVNRPEAASLHAQLRVGVVALGAHPLGHSHTPLIVGRT